MKAKFNLPEENKDCMFQYALGVKPFMAESSIIENTDLITRTEAEDLWEKYKVDFIKKLEDGYKPQMVIWIDCTSNTNYGTIDPDKDADYQDCVVENGKVYRITKKRII